jgi:TusA-related sulfurtransferase
MGIRALWAGQGGLPAHRAAVGQARDREPNVFWCGDRIRPASRRAAGVKTAPTVLDLSGTEELCSEPGALDRVRRAYAKLEPGCQLEVRSPISEHAFAVRAWSRKNGVSLVVDEPADGYRRLVLEASAAGV